mmetsp:Transcript_33598/g.88238  ORF Transcript_33598/g.88238 Transcript_33598/m.88238 type:complete len:237 (+) Transcript_33598:1865-2575(+)
MPPSTLWTVSTPRGPNEHGSAKKSVPGTTEVATYAHSRIPGSPARAASTRPTKWAAAAAIDNVADPLPALASTTTVPAFWIFSVSVACSGSGSAAIGDRIGTIVVPECPPTTSTATVCGSRPSRAPMKARLRIKSRVVTPTTLAGSKHPAARRVSATIGTVELTGLVMMSTIALGQLVAIVRAIPMIIPALTAKRSSRVIPGFRGTPAGMTTTSAPSRAVPSWSPVNPLTVEAVST